MFAAICRRESVMRDRESASARMPLKPRQVGR